MEEKCNASAEKNNILSEEEIKNKIKKAKEIPIQQLLIQDGYFDINYGYEWYPAKIINVLPDSNYEIIFVLPNNGEKKCFSVKLSNKFGFFKEHIYNHFPIQSPTQDNDDIDTTEIKKIIKQTFYNSNIEPYLLVQFLNGYLLDLVSFVIPTYNNEKEKLEILIMIIDIIHDILLLTKNNINMMKYSKNRHLILVDIDYAKITSIDVLLEIINIIFTDKKYHDLFSLFTTESINKLYEQYHIEKTLPPKKYTEFTSNEEERVQLLRNFLCDYISKENENSIINIITYFITDPISIKQIPFYLLDIISITLSSIYLVKGPALLYPMKETIYSNFFQKVSSLPENELKDINNINEFTTAFSNIIQLLHNENIIKKDSCSEYDNPETAILLYFVIRCLQSETFGKKIIAINTLNKIVDNIQNKKSSLYLFVYNFIIKNKIIELLLGENVHDEILKRSILFFHNLADYDESEDDLGLPDYTYDFLWDNYLNKHESVSSQIENIICDISKVLPESKKKLLFQKLKSLSQQICANSPLKYLEFILRLTDGCISFYVPKEDDNILLQEDKLYGIPLLYGYILDYIKEDKKENTLQIVKRSCAYLIQLLRDTTKVSDEVVEKILELLFDNIINKTSTIQSMLLIKGIIKNRDSKTKNNMIDLLDNKYDIVTLVVNDIHFYLKDKSENNTQFSLYSDDENLSRRFDFLFFFLSNDYIGWVLDFKGKEHLLVLYETFIEYGKDQMDILCKYIIDNIKNISEETTIYFFYEIISNTKYFNPSTINEKVYDLFIEVFEKLNSERIKEDEIDYKDYEKLELLLYPITFDTREDIRVNSKEIHGMDILYNILLYNTNKKIQGKICSFLRNLCIQLGDYKEDFSSDYWSCFISTLSSHLLKAYEEKNSIGISGLIRLIEKIYIGISDRGKIPEREDTYTVGNDSELYKFRLVEKNKEYKIKVGNTQSILDVRWRVGYYYDLYVNEVVFMSEDGNTKINLLDDLSNFQSHFPPKQIVLVQTEKNILLSLKNNPKILIETNNDIMKTLLSLLHDSNSDYIENAWKLIKKISSKLIIDDNIRTIGQTPNNKDTIIDINNLFDRKSLYVITITLNNIQDYISHELITEDKQKEYLDNFVNIYNGKNILLDIYQSFTIDNFLIEKDDNKITYLIGFECLISLLSLLCKIYKYIPSKDKEENKKIFNQSISLIELIINVSCSIDKSQQHEDVEFYSEIIEKERLFKSYRRDSYNSNYEERYEIYKSDNYWEYHTEAISNLFLFIDIISSNLSIQYIPYLIENSKDTFINIFIYKFIELLNPDIKLEFYDELLEAFENDNNISLIYFDIAFNNEVFNYIYLNDHRGLFYFFISSLLKKYFPKDNKLETKFIQVASSLVEYIQKETDEKLIEGYSTLLNTIIDENKPAGIAISSNYDVYEILLNQCNLSKLNENPLDRPQSKCINGKAQELIYKTISILCKSDIKLTKKIIDILSKYHLSGFWKDKCVSNWKINLSKDEKTYFVGIKNLGCTCYMNSILQQFFMIPELRESILSIEPTEEKYKNEKEQCSFYQLKKMFASLKYYESQYYNPKSFCSNFDGEKLDVHEQMDADEFYGKLIDKIEFYIKSNEDYQNLFKYIFGGISVDELIFKDCGHKRENEFFFNSIQLQVSGKRNLEESLSSYVKGEMMEGNNSIVCDECSKKIPALKRQSIKYLPNKLVLVLKRFEFDYDNMVKYKLNDYFEFPNELDMYPYTQEYLNETPPQKKSIMYNLQGVVIHVGTSESGHYYSLIKDPNDENEEWYEFNDTNIKRFNIDNLSSEAFGGREYVYTRDSKKREAVDKTENAYILIYTKRDNDIPSHFNSKITSNSTISNDLMNSINNDMYQYWVLKNISSERYQKFVIELLKNDIASYMKNDIKCRNDNFDIVIDKYSKLPKRSYDDISSNISYIDYTEEKKEINKDVFIFGCVYFMNIIVRCKEKKNLPEFTDIIKLYLNQDVNKSLWLIEEFSHFETIDEFLIECPMFQIQKIVIGLLYCSCLSITKVNKKEYISSIMKYLNTLLEIIIDKITTINIEHVFYAVYRIISLHDNYYINYLKEIEFDKFILSFLLQDKTIIPEEKPKLKEFISPSETHSILSEKISKQKLFLSTNEEGIESKFKELLSNNKNYNSLYSILFLLISPNEINEIIMIKDNIEVLLSTSRNKLNTLLISDKLYLICKNNKEKSYNMLIKIFSFLNQSEYNEIDFTLMILSRLLFVYEDELSSYRIQVFIKLLTELLSSNFHFYYFIEKIKTFILNLFFRYKEKLSPYQDEINNNILIPLHTFFNENKIPPKYIPSKNGVVLYKNQNNTYPSKINHNQFRQFEENSKKNTYNILSYLTMIIKNEPLNQGNKILYNPDEEITDFKFIYGDIVEYEGFICKVVKVLDELIEIEYDKEDIEKKKRPMTEWIDVSNRNLQIDSLKDSTRKEV